MEASNIADSNPKADIQLWGKGYRITADSEEFQRYVPKEAPQPRGLERKIQTFPWGSLLESLYALRDAEIAAQRCVLFDASDLMSISLAKTEDRHRRPSLVLTTCTIGIDWRDPRLGEVAARAAALSSRLATTYAETLRGNPELVGRQLRDNSFLRSPSFALDEELPDKNVEWAHAISAVKKWSGITGISTTRLLVLGANVVLGTKYEAERAKQQFQVDGFFDAKGRDIRALSDRLKLWEPKPEPSAPIAQEQPEFPPQPPVTSSQEQPTYPQSPDFVSVSEGLREVAHAVNRLAEVAGEIIEKLFQEKRRK